MTMLPMPPVPPPADWVKLVLMTGVEFVAKEMLEEYWGTWLKDSLFATLYEAIEAVSVLEPRLMVLS